MPQVVIENPIINSPFREPTRHFRFDDDGITDQVVDGRRRSYYVVSRLPNGDKPRNITRRPHVPNRGA